MNAKRVAEGAVSGEALAVTPQAGMCPAAESPAGMNAALDNSKRGYLYDVIEIQKLIPHRYPFLLIDRVLSLEDNQRIVATKCVSANEPFFEGHFPGRPVMPGVLILEAMAQAGAILAIVSKDGVAPGKTVFFVGANDVKFRRQVVPGDVLHIEMQSVRKRRPMWIMRGTVSVDGKVVASGELSAAEAD